MSGAAASDQSRTPLLTPASLGYHMPPEWRRHDGTWLTWPKDPVTWPDRVPQVQEIFLRMIELLAPHETVNLLVDDEATAEMVRHRLNGSQSDLIEAKGRRDRRGFRLHVVPTVDSWIRDYGPNFIIREADGAVAFNDWCFNAWGNKYETLKADTRVPSLLAPSLGLPRFEPGIVMEGGSIEVNGQGVVMTTEQCLLNPNRNPHLARTEIERALCDYLGVSHVLWLGEGVAGDDTDGHIDDIARFVAPDTIVCAVEDDPADGNYAVLQDNLRRLELARDPEGQPYRVVSLPMPGPVMAETDRLPASYANFYIANNVVLLPVFGHENDQRAIDILRPLFPQRRVVAINCEPLVWGMGAIHCVTQQQPAGAA
jgi:agmatine deiminase